MGRSVSTKGTARSLTFQKKGLKTVKPSTMIKERSADKKTVTRSYKRPSNRAALRTQLRGGRIHKQA